MRLLAPKCDLVLVVGSRNSSNSVRLTEISETVGTKAHLIDDATELDPSWFEGVETLLVTAGASAPEDLVRALIQTLIEEHGGSVEQHDVHHESIEFGLPASLKNVMRARGVDPEGRRIRRDDAVALDGWLADQQIPHSIVDLTVGST